MPSLSIKIAGIAIISALTCTILTGQSLRLKGSVSGSDGLPLPGVAVSTGDLSAGTITDKEGKFILLIKNRNESKTAVFSLTGFKKKIIDLESLINNDSLNIILFTDERQLPEVPVFAEKPPGISLVRIPVNDFRMLPSVSGGVETMLKTLPGVSSNSELSNQYSVRGGSYDENLVYVNDVEVFRPFLIRSGQQEGLPFINPDLVSSVNFSAGGFGAGYGDRLSSVLDVKYRVPTSFGGSVSPGLMLSSAHVEGLSGGGRFSFLAGFRYKSTSLMLKTMDSEGDYNPSFIDFQSVIGYKLGRSVFSLLTSFASNRYNFTPQSRSSSFGTAVEAYRLYVKFEGNERDMYSTFNAVLNFENRQPSGLINKLVLAHFTTDEAESFDIYGRYSLSTLDKNTGSENNTDTLLNIGVASWLSHARNRLAASVSTVSWKGTFQSGRTRFDWGIKYRLDNFSDHIREWKKRDSAGYSIPLNPSGPGLKDLIISDNNFHASTAELFGEYSTVLKREKHSTTFTAGMRGTWAGVTGEGVISPRISVKIQVKENIQYWFSTGLYIQPPGLREMRFPDGSISNEIKSQRAVHTVAGVIFDFSAWERPFRFTGEIYNKKLTDIIPYRIDNVRVIYSGKNEATGYSRGIDLRVNGEFVPGVESWFSLSVMDSKLSVPAIPGVMFPSPSDQRLKVSVFFQDWLPSDPTWRAHMTLTYATGIPVTSPFNERYDQYHRLPSYRRVDMGITKVILGNERGDVSRSNFLKELVAGFEVFNLLDIHNTISYLWVETVNNMSGTKRVFAVPNYLTGRSLNLKIRASF